MHCGHFETVNEHDGEHDDDDKEESTDQLREETDRGHDCKRENWNVCDMTQSDTTYLGVTPWGPLCRVLTSSIVPTTKTSSSHGRTTFTMLSVATRRVPATLATRAALARAYTSSSKEGSVAQSKEFG